MDAFFKEDENKSGQGAVKVNLKNFLIVEGKIKEIEKKGDGYVVVEFVKAAQKMKTEFAFNSAKPHDNFDLTFYPNYEKSSDKLKFSTQNLIKPKHLESK